MGYRPAAEAHDMKLPDFLILGPMKGGTTTLYRWLDQTPNVRMPAIKEPNFFAEDARFARGLTEYAKLFEHVGVSERTGEASVRYADPSVSTRVARRIRATLPDARLLFIARDPFDRLRSHYRHEVQRGRETRPFSEAVTTSSPYVRCSLYDRALLSYDRDALRVFAFDALFGADVGAWSEVLEWLSIPSAPRPAAAHNVGKGKSRFTSVARVAFELGLARWAKQVPSPVRASLRPLLMRDDVRYQRLLASSRDDLPHDARERIARDFGRFASRWM